MVRRQSEYITFRKSNRSVIRVAHTRSALRDRIQHGLDIRRRAGDDTQDFARRRLLLQRFFEFLKQPRVLDGNHGLISEGLKQLDLRRGEGTRLGATCVQRSAEFPLLKKGND